MSANPDNVVALPHAVGVEKDVLSVMFQDSAMIDEAPGLTAEHFHIPAHRIVFELMRELHSTGKPIELVSFVQTLIDRGLIDRAGGPAAISDFQLRANLKPEVFARHIEILTEKLARRMTIAVAHEMERVAHESAEPSEIIEATSAPISAIHDTLTGTSPAKSTKSVLLGCFERFQQLCNGLVDPMGIETSLFEINHRFRGLHPAQTIVVSAYPGGGKTTLAGQFAMDAATGGHNTLFVSLEMPAQALMNRMLAYVARRPGDAITDPLRYCREVLQSNGPTKDIISAIETASRKILEAPFHIEDMNGATVYQIASCIRRAHRKNPLTVVVVDYAQRIRPAPEKIRESREQQLAHASNYLADLSKELGFTLLLPSQLNKEGAAKHAEAINEDADLHLQIIQDRSGTAPTFDHIGIAVVKDRHHGHDGKMLPIILDGPMLRFIPKPFKS
jgi:replicative DNA helicase